MTCTELIRNAQATWADTGGPRDRRGYFVRVEDNLNNALDAATRSEFQRGRGNELSDKARAPWSSSALALNLLQYWRGREAEAAPLLQALRAKPPCSLTFETQHATGFGPPAHLDVELRPKAGAARPVAIESKLLEPFGKHKPLSSSYTAGSMSAERRERWAQIPGCFELAKALVTGKQVFHRLDAPQLLKHALALTGTYGAKGFDLVFLWYAPTVPRGSSCEAELAALRAEVKRFASHVRGDVHFRATTYQALYASMVKDLRGHDEYLAYLARRYFT